MSAATQFPDASLMWSSTHYRESDGPRTLTEAIRPSTGWFFPGVAPHKRPELKLLRLREMHEAAVSAFTDTRDLHPNERRLFDGVQMNRWGLAMMGQEEHQVDEYVYALGVRADGQFAPRVPARRVLVGRHGAV